MKKLELNQMENLNGYGNTTDCAIATLGLLLTGASICVVTCGVGLAFFAAASAGGVASMYRSC